MQWHVERIIVHNKLIAMLLKDEIYSANVLADVALQVIQIWTGYEMGVKRFVGGRGRGYKTMVECTWEMQVDVEVWSPLGIRHGGAGYMFS